MRADYGPVYADHQGQEPLTHEECVALLASKSLGRLGLTAGSLPYVLPVRYAVAHGRIYLRTGRGTRMEAATAGAVVVFEVDDFDPLNSSGWTVSAQGLARRAPDAEVPDDADRVLASWFGSVPAQAFAIELDVVAGQRFPSVAEMAASG